MNRTLVLLGICILGLIACTSEKYAQGKRIYEAYCINCHMQDGSGLGDLYPKLQDSPYLTDNKDDLICLIRNGKVSTQMANIEMPAHKMLREAELSNLVNYICHTWGDQQLVPITKIKTLMSNCSD